MKEIDELNILKCCHLAESLEHAYLFYQLPDNQNHKFYFSKLKNDKLGDFTFHFHPFTENKQNPIIKISDFQKVETYHSALSKEIQKLEDSTLNFSGNADFENHEASLEEYYQQANTYIQSFDEAFKKAILSRIVAKKVDSFSPIQLFKKLSAKYPSAFVYVFYHPCCGLWCGASPETLVKAQENIVSTVSLAGSMPYADNLTWGEKEKHEQQYVTDYIVEQLKKLKLSKLQVSKPYTVKAGKLAHIKTDISAEIHGVDFYKIANSLHPTPAIGGLPKEKALDLINKTEQHNRRYYCGYLGFESENYLNHFWVNLRCMQYINGKFAIYVGGGLTKDSIPEKEWEETTLKSSTMLDILEQL